MDQSETCTRESNINENIEMVVRYIIERKLRMKIFRIKWEWFHSGQDARGKSHT